MTGWAVNSIAMAVEGSSPFLPSVAGQGNIFSLYSSMVERNTVNICISVRFTLEAISLKVVFIKTLFYLHKVTRRDGLIGKAMYYGYMSCKFDSYSRLYLISLLHLQVNIYRCIFTTISYTV